MTNYMRFLYVLIIGGLLLGLSLGYTNHHPVMPPKRSYDLGSTHVLVNWFDSVEKLALAVGDDTVEGLSQCEMRPDFNTSFCELWLVRPKDETDAFNYDTIGHEFYHALVGDFHD